MKLSTQALQRRVVRLVFRAPHRLLRLVAGG
jgi:hypothetical protein